MNPILYFYVLAAIALRLLPHPWNLTPVGAMFLFSAATFRSRLEGWLVPFAALLASDVLTALLLHQGHGLFDWPVWIAFSAVGAAGWLVRPKITPFRILGVALTGALTFYLVVDFAIWTRSHTYPHTWSGLMACYIAALPFLRNDLIGNVVYCAIMFGSYAWLTERRQVASLG